MLLLFHQGMNYSTSFQSFAIFPQAIVLLEVNHIKLSMDYLNPFVEIGLPCFSKYYVLYIQNDISN